MSENSIEGPRIVLFGSPGAGKSSLLGALAQAGLTEPQVLGGRLADPSGGLAELQQRTYENKQSATREEVVAYPVIFQEGTTLPLTLIDCNGQAAQEYLDGTRSLDDRARLARAVKETDALVLTVGPAEPSQLERDFDRIRQFLRLFEQARGRRSDIAGLPVFLVLTKCDLLARKEDCAATWMERIEEMKRKTGKHFQEFVQQTQPSSFGTIDLHLGAVAVKQPALTDRPARPREPYGVAELFHQVGESARLFHDQRHHAYRRLRRSVMGLAGLIVIMGLVATGFFLSRPSAEDAALENSIRAALPAPNAPAVQRLREPLPPRFKELVKSQHNPGFARLPSALQLEVHEAIQEMTAYQELGKKIDELKPVRFFKKEEDIQTFSQQVDKIAVPADFASQWTDTRLARKMRQYKSELAALTTALTDEKDWLKMRIEEGNQLLRMTIPGAASPERQAWISKADAFLKRKDPTKTVPGVPNMKLRDLYEFPSVSSLREAYETFRSRVDKIRGGLTDS